MLQIFRNNQPLVVILLVIYAVILQADTLIHPQLVTYPQAGLLAQGVYHLMHGDPIIHNAASLVLLLVQAIWLNYLISQNKLGKEKSWYPALCYILLMSSSSAFSELTPAMMANTFILASFSQMTLLHKQRNDMGVIFNIGFWIAVASFFYFSVMVFVCIGFVILITLGHGQARKLIILMTGFLVPYFLCGVWYFSTNQFDTFLYEHILSNFQLINLKTPFQEADIVIGLVFGGLLVLQLANYSRIIHKSITQIKVYIGIFYWMLLASILSLFCQGQIDITHLTITIVPLSVLLALNLLHMRSRFLAELIHTVLFMAVIASQYKEYFF